MFQIRMDANRFGSLCPFHDIENARDGQDDEESTHFVVSWCSSSSSMTFNIYSRAVVCFISEH